MNDQLPVKFRKLPPDPPKTISDMKMGEDACVSPNAMSVDRNWGGWLPHNTPIFEEGVGGGPYLLVRRTVAGYEVTAASGGRKWERGVETSYGEGMIQVTFPV